MSNNLARPPFGIVKCVMPPLFPIDNLALTNFRLAPQDFPYANAKIVPAGYKLLREFPRRSRSVDSMPNRPERKRSRSVSPLRADDPVDGRGRRRTIWPRNGPMHLYLYAQR